MKFKNFRVEKTMWGDLSVKIGKEELIISMDEIIRMMKSNHSFEKLFLEVYLENKLMKLDYKSIKLLKLLKLVGEWNENM